MTRLATTQRGFHPQQPISRDVSVARGLLDRDDLLQTLDRAVSKRVTVISAPPGSGKTSLLRAWATLIPPIVEWVYARVRCNVGG
jgi:ATP/maltotriose-dependent transcriptional regulator MalT